MPVKAGRAGTVVVAVLLAGCARNGAPSPAPEASHEVSAAAAPVAVSATASGSAPSAASAALAASVTKAPYRAPTVPPDPRCTGASLDLNALDAQHACAIKVDFDAPALPAAVLQIHAEPPPHLAPGAVGKATVTFTNVSDGDAVLDFWNPHGIGSFGDAVEIPLGPATPPKPAPAGAMAIGLGRRSADGRSFNAGWSMLAALPRPTSRVRIHPGGKAQLRVLVPARGFLPRKSYAMETGIDDPPDPLPAGKYEFTLRLPVAVEAAEWPEVEVVVGG